MGALATLADAALTVAPGEVATTTLQVRNAGSVVDEFTFEVIGVDPQWTSIEPDVLRLLPGDEGAVQVTMAPPRVSEMPSGDLAFGIKVNSKEDPQGSVVEEGVLTIGAFAEVTAELLPRMSQGSRRGKHEIAIDNRGNEFLDASISATDPDERLAFAVAEPALVLEPGTAAFTTVEVRPTKRFWRGANKTLPFQVVVADEAAEREPVLLDGTMVQKALIPPWLIKALLALLALLLLLWILWLTLLRPTIESRATEAADEAAETAVEEALETPLEEASEALAAQDEALAEQSEAVAAQGEQVDAVTGTVNDVAEIVGEATIAPTPTPSPSPTLAEVNTDFTLSTTDAATGGASTDSQAVANDATLRVSDVVLQNPDGNEGTVRIRRNGDSLLVVSLANFRDLDYHFVTPLIFAGGDDVVLEVACTEVTAPGSSACEVAALISGTTESEAEPE